MGEIKSSHKNYHCKSFYVVKYFCRLYNSPGEHEDPLTGLHGGHQSPHEGEYHGDCGNNCGNSFCPGAYD